MNIIGDIKYANKFYIKNSKGNIEWVHSLQTAKNYVNDPQNKEWYNKDIYATNEKIIKGYDNKLYLESQVVLPPKEIKEKENYQILEKQIFDYIAYKLENEAKAYQMSLLEILSWNNSKIKRYKDLAKKFSTYRDELYEYCNMFLQNFLKNNENVDVLNDISNEYDKFLKDLPQLK